VSSARRCRKTAEQILQHSGYRGETRFTGDLYEASAAKLRESLAKIEDPHARVLLIGHNPGLEELLEALSDTYTPLTTAALAQIELPIDSWHALDGETKGHVVQTWQPRSLD
jgi:phosphohistidine phosphatase